MLNRAFYTLRNPLYRIIFHEKKLKAGVLYTINRLL